MNRFLVFVLLANLVFAHLPPTPASLRRSAAHKKRLDGSYSPPTVALHRRLSIDEILSMGGDVQILGQSPDGLVSAIVNGRTTTFLPDRVETPIPSSDTSSPSSPSSQSPAPTPPPSSPSPGTSLTSESVPSSSEPSPSPSETESPPSSSDPVLPSSTPEPTPSSSDPVKPSSQDCGPLGLLCHSSNETPSSTEAPPSPPTSDPTGTSNPPPQTSDPTGTSNPPPQTSDPTGTGNPPPQTSQSLPTTDTPPPSTTGDLCLLLGIGCPHSSTSVSEETVSTQPPPVNSDPVATQPSPSSTTEDSCLLLGISCPSSPTPVSSGSVPSQLLSTSNDPVQNQPLPTSSGSLPSQSLPTRSGSLPSQPLPTSSDPASARLPPVSSDSVETQHSPPSTTGDLCLQFGIGCPTSSSNPVSTWPPTSSDQVSTKPSSATGDICLLSGIGCSTPSGSSAISTLPPSVSSDPISTQPPPSSTTGSLCLLLGINCPPSSTPVSNVPVSSWLPPTSSDLASTRSPPVSSDPIETQQPPPSTTGDLCLLFGVGCPPSSIPVSSDSVPTRPLVSSEPPESTKLSISPNLPPFTSQPSGSTQPPSSGPPSATSVSPLLGSPTSIPSIIFPSESSDLPPSSTLNSLLISSISTSGPTPTNTQFEWLTQTTLIFSSISESVSDSLSLTDPDQVPTATSFSTAGTPSVAPSVAPLPPGIPARIVPGDGGVNPEVDDLNGFTLIAILFDRGLNWDTVVHNPDSPGQIFSWLPVLIDTALGITVDQVKSFALQVWIPNSYKGPSDVSQLGTTWMGYIPTPHVETLAAQIKVRTSLFYMGKSSPYSDLASHVNPSFDIMTVTATTGIPGSGGSNNGSTGGTSDDSNTRENAIIGVVSALGGITLIVLGYLIYRAVKKRRELAHRRLSDPPVDNFVGEAPPNRNFDQDSIGGQRRRSFYFAEDSLRGFSDHNYDSDGARLSPEQTSGLNRRPIAGNIGPPVMRENSLNF